MFYILVIHTDSAQVSFVLLALCHQPAIHGRRRETDPQHPSGHTAAMRFPTQLCHADFCQNPDRAEHCTGSGIKRHHRQRQGQDPR